MRIIIIVTGVYKKSIHANDAMNKLSLFIRKVTEDGGGSSSVDDGQNPVYVTGRLNFTYTLAGAKELRGTSKITLKQQKGVVKTEERVGNRRVSE